MFKNQLNHRETTPYHHLFLVKTGIKIGLVENLAYGIWHMADDIADLMFSQYRDVERPLVNITAKYLCYYYRLDVFQLHTVFQEMTCERCRC